jgi:hypothetical protein
MDKSRLPLTAAPNLRANEKNRVVLVLLATAITAAAAAGSQWYHAAATSRELRVEGLKPIDALLKEDQALVAELNTEAVLGTDSGILGSYLAKIRADGVAKHADMKQRLDRLAENNAAILALINVYSPHAKTASFKAEADEFRHYAIAWRDRWNSVMELFMAGGNYPVAEVPLPKEFEGAVEAEMEAAAHAL